MTARIELLITLARRFPDLTPAQLDRLAEVALAGRAARAAGVSHSIVTQVVCQHTDPPER